MGFIIKIKIKNLPTYFDDINSWCVDDNAKKKKKKCMYVVYGDLYSILGVLVCVNFLQDLYIWNAS